MPWINTHFKGTVRVGGVYLQRRKSKTSAKPKYHTPRLTLFSPTAMADN